MQLNTLKPKTKRKATQRIGRGSTRGKTSGRGHKGQKARAGHRIRPMVRDTLKRIPKRRGHGKNRARTVRSDVAQSAVVNVGALATVYDTGAEVTPDTLAAAGLIKRRGNKMPSVKLLGSGEVAKAFSVSGCLLSQTAREKIEKAGGKIT